MEAGNNAKYYVNGVYQKLVPKLAYHNTFEHQTQQYVYRNHNFINKTS
jgi:hypothetical protein